MATVESEAGMEALLQYLKDSRGFDFTGYKRASLGRRIERRMQQVGLDDYSSYASMLEANPGEFAELFDTILINVTDFLRDPEAWAYLASEVIPSIIEGRGPADAIRVWSAGTASGQEAYSLAVLFAEALGEDRYRATVKIYATDADDGALATARQGRYPVTSVLNAFGEERAARFFETDGATCTFRQDLRRSLIFGRHDLVQHPPISRIDLLVCRNTLMYFTADMQRRVLTNFHFALAEEGYLFLGKSEAMASHSSIFEVVDLKQRVFRRFPRDPALRPPNLELTPRIPRQLPAEFADVLRAGFEESPVAQIVIDPESVVTAVNRHARSMFGLAIDAPESFLKDLQISYRPLELRSLVDEVIASGRPTVVRDVAWITPSGDQEWFDVSLLPIRLNEHTGVIVTYNQVGRYKLLREELDRSQRELEGAYEELQSTVEELETTNEELQSTNEELETTNEELHSTNEELETMNEELQSTNEELETANTEMQDRGFALDQTNTFLESILAGLRSGVVVLNPEMTVRAWNAMAEDMWGLRADEVEGLHFLNLDIGLPVDELRAAIRACLNGSSAGEYLKVSAINRRGRSITCAVTISPLQDGKDVLGVILVLDA
jgi:two-component system CheB/CheR fusion protein